MQRKATEGKNAKTEGALKLNTQSSKIKAFHATETIFLKKGRAL